MVKFTPKERKPGDHIRAEDWNSMQREIRDDLLQIEESIRLLGHRKGVVMGRGIASHDIFVSLNWDTEPHIIMQFLFPLEPSENKKFRCYAHEVSKAGFRVYALSEDGTTPGVVEWIAIGIR